MTTILLVDDHKIFREGIKSLFDQTADFQVVAMASDGQMAVDMARENVPDIVIMDVSMPAMNGIEATRQISYESPGSKVLALSMHAERNFVLQMLRAGAVGYLLKDEPFEDLLKAIKLVLDGGTYLPPSLSKLLVDELQMGQQPVLTPREVEVLRLLASGESTKQVAEALFLSIKTVETHRSNIMTKLDLHNLADLTRYAIRNGLIKA